MDDNDIRHLRPCIELAAEALDASDVRALRVRFRPGG
ncbi:hypothetical protein DE4585_01758 [Mycobacteroides salmoniphilum]|uniref:Uncharacterized protein n=1 Tax=Mycobacteroides salmoniphilum TaxID=404941 RepID=A0A4R8S1I3_9MYCO|nr:hypothetical protein DE4586_03279 [Mycobacteroides salmoniphilum]TDZ82965.1 hypothetical protein DE4585_01758 [Mycobacteroides salmoniphilum]TDZ83907.1 hypothetical protein DE4587_02821 [Mycobacteroides salmoniphilum]